MPRPLEGRGFSIARRLNLARVLSVYLAGFTLIFAIMPTSS